MGPRALRVLQVMECTIGGTRRHLTDVARGLLAEGVEVHLAVAAERQPDFRDTLQELESEGCTLHEIPMQRSISPTRDGRHLRELIALLRQVQPDIVHTHSSKAGVLGRLASVRTGIGKRVHTPHTLAFLFREMFGPAKRALFYSLEKALARSTHAMVAVSPSEARTFEGSKIVAHEKIRVVPNGIDPAPFFDATPIDLATTGLDPARPTLAVVGLLNVAKGQDIALQALSEVGTEKDLQLVFAGHGEMEQELSQLANELGLSERVAFLGFRQDVPRVLAACDGLLLPSRWEGMPYIVLEAMASALPVVTTPVDGARDLVVHGESGLIAEEITAASLALQLEAFLCLDPDQRLAMGEAGRVHMQSSFTAKSMVDELLKLYRAILSPTHR